MTPLQIFKRAHKEYSQRTHGKWGNYFADRKSFIGSWADLTRKHKMSWHTFKTEAANGVVAVYQNKIQPSEALVGFPYIYGNSTENYSDGFNLSLQKHLHSLGIETAIGPINGGIHYGLSVPDSHAKSAFLTTQYLETVSAIFRSQFWTEDRNLYAYRTQITDDLTLKIEEHLGTIPLGYTLRPFSKLYCIRDLKIYNTIVSQSMVGQPYFTEQTDKECFQSLKLLLPILDSSLIQFICHNGNEVGFCFAIPDFNEVLLSKYAIKNYLGLLTKNHYTGGRIIYSNMLPAYKGKGLIKYPRYRVIQNMSRRGITYFESSYIDQDNLRSLNNVKSLKAEICGRFSIYRFKT